ncbi:MULTISPECIES: hypothetical protein [unclassified Paenibacillus]|uniref:hypothetical protein n=1 Tax=unclassified Paenibacillus TaxID=185978 RepID=UPI000B04D86A|nr:MULTISPECIES: hypothetical protein [unclassified Paenibacillus]
MALELKGDRYDIGDKFGYMKAIVELGLQRDELRPQLLAYLDILLQKELGKEKLRRRVV